LIYFGWITFFLMAYVLIWIFRKVKYMGGRAGAGDSMTKRYGRAVGSSLVALSVQPIFHNDSLFSMERTTWMFFLLLILWNHYALCESKEQKRTGFKSIHNSLVIPSHQ